MVIHDEVSVTRILRHPVRKDLAISEEGFIVVTISRKQKVNHAIKTTIFPITASHTFKTQRRTALSPSAVAPDTQKVKIEV
jgi:hypothetical protein